MESSQGHGPGLHRVTVHQTKRNRLSLSQRSCTASIREKSPSQRWHSQTRKQKEIIQLWQHIKLLDRAPSFLQASHHRNTSRKRFVVLMRQIHGMRLFSWVKVRSNIGISPGGTLKTEQEGNGLANSWLEPGAVLSLLPLGWERS